jgi:hypothetical protein
MHPCAGVSNARIESLLGSLRRETTLNMQYESDQIRRAKSAPPHLQVVYNLLPNVPLLLMPVVSLVLVAGYPVRHSRAKGAVCVGGGVRGCQGLVHCRCEDALEGQEAHGGHAPAAAR